MDLNVLFEIYRLCRQPFYSIDEAEHAAMQPARLKLFTVFARILANELVPFPANAVSLAIEVARNPNGGHWCMVGYRDSTGVAISTGAEIHKLSNYFGGFIGPQMHDARGESDEIVIPLEAKRK